MFRVLAAVSFCHVLNDMMQSLLPSIYPILKASFHLNFTQIGFITLTFQITASLLQPVIGHYTDRKPMPYSLPIGMVFTLVGLLLLAIAPTFPLLLLAAALIGMGSAVFHPESSRVAEWPPAESTASPNHSSRSEETQALRSGLSSQSSSSFPTGRSVPRGFPSLHSSVSLYSSESAAGTRLTSPIYKTSPPSTQKNPPACRDDR